MTTPLARLTLLACLALPAGARADDLSFYEKEVNSPAQCHAAYAGMHPDWQTNKAFKLSTAPDGRERAIMCLPDGVSEWICDPRAGVLHVAVQVDKTLKDCSRLTPKLPVLPQPSLFAPKG